MAKVCGVCRIAIVPGEEVVDDPTAYWASGRQLHRSCFENPPDLWTPEMIEARQETRAAAPRTKTWSVGTRQL